MRHFFRRLLVAGTTAGLLTAALVAPAAADPTPVPRPTRGLGSPATPCPEGQTPTQVTSRAPTRTGGRTTTDPDVTTYPDGHTVRQACALAPPVPMKGPVIAPEHTVGGAALASPGVVTDLPTGVPAPPELPHVSYVLADLQTGEIVAAKAAHALLYPASTLKALTALVALPKLDPSRVVTATAEDVTADGTRVGMLLGSPYRVEDLFNGMLMVSGNDTAYAIARVYGGRDQIIADMNAEAARLGAWDTVAVDPSGLDADGQRTSAYDLALIGTRRDGPAAVPAARSAPAGAVPRRHRPVRQGGRALQIANHNPLMQSYPGTVGVKTGYTTKARNTFIAAVTRGERTLLLAEMGSVLRQSEPTQTLLDWGFAYAGRARPVGTLVAPGAPRPPEWGPAASVTESSLPASADETMTIAAAQGSSPTQPVEALVADAVSSRWDALGPGGRLGFTVAGGLLVLLFAWLVVRARRRRHRGAYER